MLAKYILVHLQNNRQTKWKFSPTIGKKTPLLPLVGFFLLYLLKNLLHISRNKLHIKQLKHKFQKSTSFTTEDVCRFYESLEPEINRNTVKWRIHELVKIGEIIRIGRGIYTIGASKSYSPEFTMQLKAIYWLLIEQFPFSDIRIWDTRFLSEFMVHQPASYMILVETEIDVIESVFNYLREENKKVFLNPNEDTINKYIAGEKDPIIIKPLISEAPFAQDGRIKTTTIEKMLVDIYCDKALFNSFQGKEMDNIFQNAIDRYTINQSKLLRYASRRGKKKELKEILNKILTNGNK